MLSENTFLNETKNHNPPPPPFKLNGWSLTTCVHMIYIIINVNTWFFFCILFLCENSVFADEQILSHFCGMSFMFLFTDGFWEFITSVISSHTYFFVDEVIVDENFALKTSFRFSYSSISIIFSQLVQFGFLLDMFNS